jgi:aryl-alcohol dehydrogenase-like predicted oxidoreductase
MAPQTSIRLGNREIPRMGLGTNRLTNTPQNVELIRAAAAAGIGMIDSAHLYTGGRSEETIGSALGGREDGNSPLVATKGGFQRGQGRRDLLSTQIEQSLRSLRAETIDLYYLHRVDPDTPIEDSLATIRDFVERGRVRLVGLSEVGLDQIERARRIVPIAAVQNQYNLADRGWDEVVDYCEREEIVFVPFFPLRGTGGFAPANRRSAQCDHQPDSAGLAPPSLTPDPADPGDAGDRPPRGERRGTRHQPERRGVRRARDPLTPSGVAPGYRQQADHTL